MLKTLVYNKVSKIAGGMAKLEFGYKEEDLEFNTRGDREPV